MQLMADMPAVRHDLQDAPGDILGMAGHKADPVNADLIGLLKQLVKRRAVNALAVGVHILPQKHDLMDA
jgi:hypothetical protein